MEKIGFIGGGNMAEALIKGISHRFRDIVVSEPKEERRNYLEKTYGIKTTPHNREVASASKIIILAIKPQNIQSVLEEIRDTIDKEKTIVSIAAGIRLSYLKKFLDTEKIIRVMPNTPALIGEAMNVISMCECFSGKEIDIVREIFMSTGKVITLPEHYMDQVTAISGSGPAFIAYFIEGVIEAGMRIGLSKNICIELCTQTLLGTARLLESGFSPERLREMVTSPGGTTEAGLRVFNEKNLKDIVIEGIITAKKRAEELSKI